MAIPYERFQLALTQLPSEQWRLLERLANVYMSTEFPSLRPVAAASGDGGADALLFAPEDDESVILQYSVQPSWQSKIRGTAKRLQDTFPKVKVLIYVTNQDINAKSAEVRRNIRRDFGGLHVDIRDREWLLTNRNASTANEAEAAELARLIVDPILAAPETIARQAQALDDLEAKAAFVYLGLQWADDNREKGLTKLCFEAIVRSVLRSTTSDDRLARVDVHEAVKRLLPTSHVQTLTDQVNGALTRLSKRYIRHWKKVDEFCLTWDERVRLDGRITALAVLDEELREALQGALATSASEMGEEVDVDAMAALVEAARRVLERVLLDRGEAFASAVAHERGEGVRYEDVEAVVDRVVAVDRINLPLPAHVLASTIQSVMASPPDAVRAYLRSLADTYTLFAFMRETPDVQSAVVKIFSDADIWLDTSVVLPLMAEELLETEDRAHTHLVAAARECGLRLHITDGVLEELVTHVQRCVSYYRHTTSASREAARGEPPFLYAVYRLNGRDAGAFLGWVENFIGADPETDLLEYLGEVHGIESTPLIQHSEQASVELRAAVAEVWQETREVRARRQAALGLPPMDSTTRDRLVSHDVENYVGVVQRREARGERRSAFGYKSWWLTLDRTAFRVVDKLRETLKEKPPASPAISPDFMLNFLAIGPVRGRLSRKTEEALPLMLNMSVLDAVPADLVDLATELRGQLQDLPPRVVRRKIKETLEDARQFLGPKADAGELGLTQEIKTRLIESAKHR